ncbi:MAG TPA: class I SAM-dependent methyltransferase [Thermoanaerobaculia bacterium]|nr:class I SAM-dependent methyltransferase [Thermoanaerobaculia bacterium]
MPIGYFAALRLLHRTFAGYPLRARMHILGRFLTCPFLRTLDVIPPGSRVLDIGAGHGTYARLLVEDGTREVIAVEPDVRKCVLAYRHPAVRFVAGFDSCIRGTFDVVVLYDVIYRIPLSERDELFQSIFDRVRPGGLFVFKDLDPENRPKMLWNRLQEKISDTFFHLTLGRGFHYETRREFEARIRRAGFESISAREIDRGYPHAHIIYTASRPVGEGG